jgi:hypothetical protein
MWTPTTRRRHGRGPPRHERDPTDAERRLIGPHTCHRLPPSRDGRGHGPGGRSRPRPPTSCARDARVAAVAPPRLPALARGPSPVRHAARHRPVRGHRSHARGRDGGRSRRSRPRRASYSRGSNASSPMAATRAGRSRPPPAGSWSGSSASTPTRSASHRAAPPTGGGRDVRPALGRNRRPARDVEASTIAPATAFPYAPLRRLRHAPRPPHRSPSMSSEADT